MGEDISLATYGNDEIGAGDRIDGEAPEVDEAGHVHQRQHNSHQHLIVKFF